MKTTEMAEQQAEKAYEGFIKYSKAAVYWILAILVILAYFDFGADRETGSQYNGEVYAPMNLNK